MIPLVLALAVAVVATVHDLRTRTLPDWLTLGAAALGAVVHLATSSGATSIFGALACVVIPAILVRGGGLGRGDLKLFVAVGAILGPSLGIEAELYAFAAAFVAAPLLAWKRGRLGTMLARAWGLASGRTDAHALEHDETAWMPFAPAILVGVLVVAAGSGVH